MPSFSSLSQERLKTCHADLQEILNEVIKEIDFTILCGFRNEQEQEEAFRTGRSTKHWPSSNHNREPSLAVDIAPYPVDWNDLVRFARLIGYLERVAWEKAIPVRWGGDWNDNGRTKDEKFVDMPHLELVL